MGSERQFHKAIVHAFDYEMRQKGGSDFYYDRYVPALHTIALSVTDIADSYWLSDPLNTEIQQWAPACIEDAIKNGIRAGYAWAKAELVVENG